MTQTTVSGPKAPKDPEKQRKKAYLMLDAAIESMPRPDGSFMEIIYLEGRIPAKLKVICPEMPDEICQGLSVTESFRKMIYAIGVTVTSNEEQYRSEPIHFLFDQYGKEDKYNGGSKWKADGICDGSEIRIKMSDLPENPNDSVPGTIFFRFDRPGIGAKASVCFYFNDGYDVPEPVIDPPVDFASEAYEKLIAQSLLSEGKGEFKARLQEKLDRIKKGEALTYALIGGSITQGAGAKPQVSQSYAAKSYAGLKEAFQNPSLKYVKAGVGGTSSEFGIVRYDRDVTKDGAVEPDIVVVEYAVNDAGDETGGVCYESLVRKILAAPNRPAVVLLFAVFMNDFNLEERLVPIGERYGLPMVSIKSAVTAQFYEEKPVITKRQFFYDIFHPSNEGHRVMTDSLMNLYRTVASEAFTETDRALAAKAAEEVFAGIQPVYGPDFEKLFRVDRAGIPEGFSVSEGSFTAKETVLQAAEWDDREMAEPMFTANWKKENSDGGKVEPFVLKGTFAKAILVFLDSADTAVGKADIFVDGKFVRTVDPLETGWTHCNTAVALNEKEAAAHEISVTMHPGDEGKQFTILGFGLVTEA